MIDKTYKWYIIYTKNQHERKVHNDVKYLNIQTFFPTVKKVRFWSDRKKTIEIPLFPNYLFLKLSNKEYISILQHPSVIQFVKDGNNLSTITEKQIRTIQIIVNEQMEYFISNNNPQKGSEVKILKGPLKDLSGKVVHLSSKTYAIVQLNQIRQSIYVKIDKNTLAICN